MDDFLIEIEIEGLSSRIKRLSDALLYSTKDLYKAEGLDIEPNWNLVFRLLQTHKELTITEISERLQFSHPAIIKIISKMKKKGYVDSCFDKNDGRKQLLTLTNKAKRKIATLEPYWVIGANVIQDLLEDSPNFLEELTKIEKKIKEADYKERALLKLNENENTN